MFISVCIGGLNAIDCRLTLTKPKQGQYWFKITGKTDLPLLTTSKSFLEDKKNCEVTRNIIIFTAKAIVGPFHEIHPRVDGSILSSSCPHYKVPLSKDTKRQLLLMARPGLCMAAPPQVGESETHFKAFCPAKVKKRFICAFI